MPTYTYVCEQCAKEMDVFQKITDEPLHTCPECGGKLRKKISGGVGLVFKGSGFYITDYKNKKTPSVKHPKAQKSKKKAS
ncbi:MAG: zinc ribbon domain-containing protein [Deltaproteobacteria bacterium]|nr:MAG: zinc ribbon domain-containing protein [Deltaproteobacteria bacterium]